MNAIHKLIRDTVMVKKDAHSLLLERLTPKEKRVLYKACENEIQIAIDSFAPAKMNELAKLSLTPIRRKRTPPPDNYPSWLEFVKKDARATATLKYVTEKWGEDWTMKVSPKNALRFCKNEVMLQADADNTQ